MKKILATLAFTTILATSAGAQFTSAPVYGDNNPRCYITKSWSNERGPDRDPVAFITPILDTTGFDGSTGSTLEIQFTMRSGAQYLRSAQYHNATLTETEHNRYDFLWTGWYGGNVRMTGHFYKVFVDDHPGHAIWHYDEHQTKNGANTMWMNSTCRT